MKISWDIRGPAPLWTNESWIDQRNFAKRSWQSLFFLPQDGPRTSDRRLIELESQVQCLMEAHLAPTQPTQVNKVTTSCEIYSGPDDTQYCMEDPKQAFLNTHPRVPMKWEFEKALLDFDSHQERRLSHLRTQLGQQQDDRIGKINLLWKTISEKLNDISTPENAGNSMAPKSIAVISHVKREELRKKGIKRPLKLFSQKYLSPASIKELNKNLSAPKRVHFINLIVILSTDSDTE
ncbi:hypothetical protein Tco_0484174 [Tanacetum coccineum]